jgi:rod shape-determining protein MreC
MVERSQKEVWRLAPWLMIALLLGNFILMAFDAREPDSKQRMIRVWAQAAADFVQSPVTSLTAAASGYFESVSNLRNASSENDLLKERVQQLEMELQGKQTLTTENERLKALLKLQEENPSKVLPAKIIGRDPSNWFNTAIINKGSYAGVKVNMPIVTTDGLVGRVIAVSPLTAQFILLTDDRSATAAIVGKLGESDALGVVSGVQQKGLLEMKYVPGSIDVQEGQTVFTTGQDGLFPTDLKLGEVVEVRRGSATVSHTIYIKPAAKISSLQEVAVLLYEAPLRQKFEQALPNALPDAVARPRPATTPAPAASPR